MEIINSLNSVSVSKIKRNLLTTIQVVNPVVNSENTIFSLNLYQSLQPDDEMYFLQ